MKRECFNALNAIDIRACEALPVRQMRRMVERLCLDENGKRRVLAEPPSYKGKYNPLTQSSNREQGIKENGKGLRPAYYFPDHSAMVAAAD